MADRQQILRSSTKGTRPTGKQPGEMYINYPDRQLGVIDTTNAAMDLLAIRAFSAQADYNAGDLVVNAGVIYRATASVAAAAWDATKWTKIADAAQTFTATRVPFADATGALTDDAGMVYDAATDKLTLAGDAIIHGITVGTGAGAGVSNVALGASALSANTAGGNTAVGNAVLSKNVGGASNTAVGNGTLTSNISGNDNTAIGAAALAANTTGYNNAALGIFSLQRNIGGYNNTAFGKDTMSGNTSGAENTALGTNSLFNNTVGNNNVAVGGTSLWSNTSGNANTSVGFGAMYKSTASTNTAIGYSAMGNCTTGANNVCVGASSGGDALINIVAQSNHVVIGNNTTTNAICKVAWATTSDVREKEVFGAVPHGLAFVNALPTISYKFKKNRSDATAPEDAPLHYGFPAQDILALEGNGVIVNADDPGHLRLNSADLIPVLVNAIKELSAEIDKLKGI